MYVCLCHGITERHIREAARTGAADVGALAAATGCGTGCGSCTELAAEILREERAVALALPVYAAAA